MFVVERQVFVGRPVKPVGTLPAADDKEWWSAIKEK